MPSTAPTAPPEKPADSGPVTAYGPETPWLCWDRWAKGQTYKEANPPWFRAFTSIWTDPKKRQVWEPHGDKAAALLFRLRHHMAARSRIGVVWGDPVALQRELGMSEPLDLSWLLEAGWCLYISDAEKQRRELEADEPQTKAEVKQTPAEARAPSPAKQAAVARDTGAAEWLRRNPGMRAADLAEQLGCSVRTVYGLAAWRHRNELTAKTAKTEESRGEERQRIVEETPRSSASVREDKARAQSLRVSPVQAEESRKEQGTGQEGPAEPEGQQATEKPVEPVNPHEPEARGDSRERRPRRPSRPPRASLRGEPQILGSVHRLYWKDPDSVAFGEHVFAALWPNRSTDTDNAKSEIGAFAKLHFNEIRTAVPTLEQPHFRLKAIAIAKHIAKNHKAAQRRGAVLTSLIRQRLGAGGARASPAARC